MYASLARRLLLGTLLILIIMGFVYTDLTNSNRPHELRFGGVVGVLALVNTLACWKALSLAFRTWKRRRSPRPSAGQYALFPLSVSYGLVSAFVLVASFGMLWANLRAL